MSDPFGPPYGFRLIIPSVRILTLFSGMNDLDPGLGNMLACQLLQDKQTSLVIVLYRVLITKLQALKETHGDADDVAHLRIGSGLVIFR